MRTTDAETLLRGVMNLQTGKADLPGVEEFPSMRGHLDLALDEGWRSEWWPPFMKTEERYFRLNWSSLTTYGAAVAGTFNAANEVFDGKSQRYFQSLHAANLNNAPTIAGVENSAHWAECRTSYSGPDWATGTVFTVVNGAARIVRNPEDNRHYQCHTAHTAGASFDPTKFGLLTPFERCVDLDQNGQTPIGEVFDVKDDNPRATKRWCSLCNETLEDRVYVITNRVRVWIDFRRRRPRLRGDNWNSETIYPPGGQSYFTPATVGAKGNWYDTATGTNAGESPSTHPAKWRVLEIPEIFEGFLIWSAYGKSLTGEGQADKRTDALAMAEGYLSLEADNVFRQQGQSPALPVRPY